ncbi:hypothetical protein AMECASPLE_014053, partial [Ameca splendens]
CLTGQSPDCTLVQSKEDDFDWEQGDTRDRPNSNPWIPAARAWMVSRNLLESSSK